MSRVGLVSVVKCFCRIGGILGRCTARLWMPSLRIIALGYGMCGCGGCVLVGVGVMMTDCGM